MSGRILRQYIEDFQRAQERAVQGQPGQRQMDDAVKALQDQHIGVSSSKGTYRGWVSDSVANRAQAIADAATPKEVKGGPRMYQSSRDAIADAQAYQQEQISDLRGIFSGRARGWHEDAVQGRIENIAGAFDDADGIRFHGRPSFTQAQMRKLNEPNRSRAVAAQAMSGAEEDPGLIGRWLRG